MKDHHKTMAKAIKAKRKKEAKMSKFAETCIECGGELAETDDPPFGPPRHFICPESRNESEFVKQMYVLPGVVDGVVMRAVAEREYEKNGTVSTVHEHSSEGECNERCTRFGVAGKAEWSCACPGEWS